MTSQPPPAPSAGSRGEIDDDGNLTRLDLAKEYIAYCEQCDRYFDVRSGCPTDVASALSQEQTCRDHGPHLGFHWCPECYQRAFTAGVESTKGAGGSAPPQEAEHYDTGNPQHCHSCAISALVVAEATRTALEAEKATAEEGRLSALRHCARLEKQLTALEGALKAITEEMRIIERVAGQCSVEGPQDTKALMAAAEAVRAGRWADRIDTLLSAIAAAGSADLRKEISDGLRQWAKKNAQKTSPGEQEPR